MQLTKDSKELFKLLLVLIILIISSLAVSYYSNTNTQNKELLFPTYETDTWIKIEVDNLSLDLSDNTVIREKTLNIEYSKELWSRISSDLEQISIVEHVDQAPSEVIKSFEHNKDFFSVTNKNNIQTTYFIGELQETTGNFWIKIVNKDKSHYVLCESDISFDGFYQTVLEGKKISYYQFKNYFTHSYAAWVGKNFWSQIDQLIFKSDQASLFSINLPSYNINPASPPDAEIDTVSIKDYVENFRRWVPGKVESVSTELAKDLSHENNLSLEIVDQQQRHHFVITSRGLWWLEKQWLMPITENFRNSLLVLKDKFLLIKVKSLAKLWSEIQKEDAQKLRWLDLKYANKTQELTFAQIKNNPSWKAFFCLFSQCLDEKINVFMKVDQLNDLQKQQWIKQADHALEYQDQKYYFKQDTYRLQVLSPLGTKFIFITKVESFYPELR